MEELLKQILAQQKQQTELLSQIALVNEMKSILGKMQVSSARSAPKGLPTLTIEEINKKYLEWREKEAFNAEQSRAARKGPVYNPPIKQVG